MVRELWRIATNICIGLGLEQEILYSPWLFRFPGSRNHAEQTARSYGEARVKVLALIYFQFLLKFFSNCAT